MFLGWGPSKVEVAVASNLLPVFKREAVFDCNGTAGWDCGATPLIASYSALIDFTVLESTKFADAPPLNVTLVIVMDVRYTTKQRMVVLEQSIVVPLPLLFRTTLDPSTRGGMVSSMTLLQLALPASTPAGKTIFPFEAELMNSFTVDKEDCIASNEPESLAAKILPLRSIADALMLLNVELDVNEVNTGVKKNETLLPAEISPGTETMRTLLNGSFMKEALPKTRKTGEMKTTGVNWVQVSAIPESVTIIMELSGNDALGVNNNEICPIPLRIVCWMVG